MNSSFGAPADKPENLQEGQIFEGRFEILSVLGKGGTGTVYKARHMHMDRTVAIKTLISSAGWVDDDTFLRFEKEAKAAAALAHANIISILDFGRSVDGRAYLVMEYLGSTSLDDVLKNDGHLTVERFYRIFSQICDGLQHAHKKGIIHRDIKPSNIMLMDIDDATDVVKVVDFGLAKLTSHDEDIQLTKTGAIMGTPLYMSPEQCRGLELDHRSDIYSLGCVMYKALTDKLPILGATPLDTLYKHTTENPPSFSMTAPQLGLPFALEQAILKSLNKDPGQRQQSMAALRSEIRDAILSSGLRKPSESFAAMPTAILDTQTRTVPVLSSSPASANGANSKDVSNYPDYSRSSSHSSSSNPPASPPSSHNPIASSLQRASAIPTEQVQNSPSVSPAAIAIGGVLVLLVGVGAFILHGKGATNENADPKHQVMQNSTGAKAGTDAAESLSTKADENLDQPRTPDSQLAKDQRAQSEAESLKKDQQAKPGSKSDIALASAAIHHVSHGTKSPVDTASNETRNISRIARETRQKFLKKADLARSLGKYQEAEGYYISSLSDELTRLPERVKFSIGVRIIDCQLKQNSDIKRLKLTVDDTMMSFKADQSAIVLNTNQLKDAYDIWRTMGKASFKLAAAVTDSDTRQSYLTWTAYFYGMANATWIGDPKIPEHQRFLQEYLKVAQSINDQKLVHALNAALGINISGPKPNPGPPQKQAPGRPKQHGVHRRYMGHNIWKY